MPEQAILKDAFGAQLVPSVDQRDLGGDVGEVERLLHRRVATADDDDLLAAEEEAVARGAGRDAEALEGLLGGQAEPFRLGARGDDQRVAAVGVAAVAGQAEGPLRQVDGADVIVDDARADMLGLQAHLLHQPGPLDGFGEARVILDLRRDGELATLLKTGDQNRLQHGTGRIDGRGVACRAGAQDEDLSMRVRHGGPIDCSPFQASATEASRGEERKRLRWAS
jgi:hypothetical protein